MVSRRLLGTAVTDANGLAVLSDGYTGTGAGLVDIIAQTTIDESTVVSQQYEVVDTLFYDVGTTGTINPKWYYSFSTQTEDRSFISTSNGLKFTNNSTTAYQIAPNISGNSSPSTADMVTFSDGTVCEFVIVSKTATTLLQTRNGSANVTQHDISNTTGLNIKLTYKDGVVSVKANDIVVGSNQSQTGDVMIRIQATNGYFEFKEFKVYPI